MVSRRFQNQRKMIMLVDVRRFISLFASNPFHFPVACLPSAGQAQTSRPSYARYQPHGLHLQ